MNIRIEAERFIFLFNKRAVERYQPTILGPVRNRGPIKNRNTHWEGLQWSERYGTACCGRWNLQWGSFPAPSLGRCISQNPPAVAAATWAGGRTGSLCALSGGRTLLAPHSWVPVRARRWARSRLRVSCWRPTTPRRSAPEHSERQWCSGAPAAHQPCRPGAQWSPGY